MERRGRLAAAYDWLDERAAIRRLLRVGLYEAVPVKGAWFYSLGSATLVLIILQLVTGIFLTMLYVPSVTEAWASLDYVKQHDAFGSIVRGIHLWSAYVLLFVIGLHMVRTFASGSYKRPRELNWISGVLLLVLVLGMAITGAFLPWDQAAYWTAVVVTNIPAYTPVIGPFVRTLWRGGDAVGPVTLTRTFGIHIWLIPALLFPMIFAHLALLRKHGEFGSYVNYRGHYRTREGVDTPPAPEARPIEPPYPAAPSDELWAAPLETEDFYPYQTFKDGVVSLVLVAAVFLLAVLLGAPLEEPADAATTAYTPVPEWFFLPLDQLLVLVPRELIPLILVLPAGGVALLVALPFLDRDKERNPFERPAVLVMGGLIVLFMLALTLLGAGRLFNL
ncbi:MAG: ubiquinol-cytochrome c reductase cytochrome b subunit [Chloroflexota bacterium]|jgi:quinol-cytochrome oxidoreductase complex cytochrome b subunit|nr:ubiquinol-cytochrome c reductase cytochrome b subunit [Chloroflexota bacterium]